jgi:hypothetical protein
MIYQLDMKIMRLTWFLLFNVISLACFAQANYFNIKKYEVYYGLSRRVPTDWVILRRFENAGRNYFVMVNPQTLITRVDEAAGYPVQAATLTQLRKLLNSSPYAKALRSAESKSVQIQDAGIERGLPKETGISLTADLCPSHRPLDRRIFTTLFAEFGKVEQPVPIALSITGIWMRQHPQDLAWLKELQQQQKIYITWINHSYNHRVSLKAPLKENFLLEPGTNIGNEVLLTEQAMLRNGLLPSVFFRFPGLVSDQNLVTQITDYGLIPVGTDAWLAKGQQPQNGSIVLIHGNGNEPVGVNDFINLLRAKTRQIAGKQWLLYDLRESVDSEFEDGGR